jgi:phytoene dehydrogenase-like protein
MPGPTVFTMRDVFDDLFAEAGESLDDHVAIRPAEILARHAWDDGPGLDLFAEHGRSVDAIGDFAGAEAARGYRAFAAEAKRIHDILDRPFMRAGKAWPPALMWRIGLWRLGALIAIRPYEHLWGVLGEHFRDPRLRQLFGRYSTYCGSSPFAAPATLMLIAHVEARGVWLVEGGMSALAAAVERLARAHGVRFHYGERVEAIEVARGRASGVRLAGGERLPADAVIANCDPAAIAAGRLGEAARAAVRPYPRRHRSLSAFTWMMEARASGRPLLRHNVLFSPDYPAEFRDIAPAGRPNRRASMSARSIAARRRATATALRRARPSESRSSSTRPPMAMRMSTAPRRSTDAASECRRGCAHAGSFWTRFQRRWWRARTITSICFRRRVEPFMDGPRTGGRPPSSGRAPARGSLGFIARAGAPIRGRECRWPPCPRGWRSRPA